jgi:hypothetical protein
MALLIGVGLCSYHAHGQNETINRGIKHLVEGLGDLFAAVNST